MRPRGEESSTADVEGLRRFLEGEVLPWFENRMKELANRPLSASKFGEAHSPDKLERVGPFGKAEAWRAAHAPTGRCAGAGTAKRLAVEVEPTIRSSRQSNVARKFTKRLISVLLEKTGCLEDVSAKPGAHTALLARRVFDCRQKARAEPVATFGFGNIEQFDG